MFKKIKIFPFKVNLKSILPRIKATICHINCKNSAWVLGITVLIVLPLGLTIFPYLILPIDKDSYFFRMISTINLNSILIIAPLCSLIINNWKKDKPHLEKGIENLAKVIFACVISTFCAISILYVFSFFFRLFSDGDSNIFFTSNKLKITIHLIIFIIFIIFIYSMLAIDEIMEYLSKYPHRLFAMLWSLLLLGYILYEIVFKLLP